MCTVSRCKTSIRTLQVLIDKIVIIKFTALQLKRISQFACTSLN